VKFKTFLLLLYNLVAGWSVTCFLSYYFIFKDVISQELTNYLACERDGPGDCPASLTQHLGIFQNILTTSVVLLMLVPLVILALNTELDCCCKRNSTEE
jgi:hypothetical protein